MKMQINEFAKLTGVSVRTLRYYDEIALLKPAFVDNQNGYRFYDETSFSRMQEILFYRELDFDLRSILNILSSPDYDKKKALAEQRKLLVLKKKRLERIIDALDSAEKGGIIMSVFDDNEYETARSQYEAEAKQRFGETDAYREYSEKTAGYSKNDWQDATDGLMEIFKRFAECKKRGEPAESAGPQELAKDLQEYLTANFYTCSKEILQGLGAMYVADERFRNNIDFFGEGTAEFASHAIQIYCK